MKKIFLLITLVITGFSFSFGQGTVSRPGKQKTEQKKTVSKKKAQPQSSLTPDEMVDKGWSAEQNGDYTEAVKWYRKAADQGLARGQYNLGNMYRQGLGVSKDYSEAVKWYRKAVEQGHAMAQCNLGYMYKNGLGVSQDYSEAVKWYRKAAEQGNTIAQYNLGNCYKDGRGVSKDLSEARRWFEKAAAQGDEDAVARLKEL